MVRTTLILLLSGFALVALQPMACDCSGGDDDDDGKPLCERFCDRLLTCDTVERLGLDTMAECIDFCHEVDSAVGSCVMAATGCEDVDACFPAGDDDDNDNDDDNDTSPYPGVFHCQPEYEDDEGPISEACLNCEIFSDDLVTDGNLRCFSFIEVGDKTWSVCSSKGVSWYCSKCFTEDRALFCGYSDWRLPTLDELRTLVGSGLRNTEEGARANIKRPFNLFLPRVWSNQLEGEAYEAYALFFDFYLETVRDFYPDVGGDEENPHVCSLIVRP